MGNRMDHRIIWNKFCARFNIAASAVPLFEVQDGVVTTKEIGVIHKRRVLQRSIAMNEMIRSHIDILVEDWRNNADKYDGLIYLMFHKIGINVIPLYIGKAETIGKGNRNLSANIKNIHTDQSKFARWGDNYAYHIGDLSAVAVPGHKSNKSNSKYVDWSNSLFKDYPADSLRLKQPVFFWGKAWKKDEVGIWEDFGPTRLTFLEYLLIGVASSVFPDELLNREGQNRAKH